jgi:hypothetical protein
MEKENPQISFIIVNFKGRELLSRCLASVDKIVDVSKELILINNDSVPLIAPALKSCPLKLIQSPQNIGFGRGVNLGAAAAKGEYLFFLNPDAELVFSALRPALQKFEADARLAILGAKIIDAKNNIQEWSAGEKITPWRIVKNNLGFDPNKIFREQIDPLEVDWVSGGALLIRKDIFQKLGGFDEKFFLYWEDVDLCRRARKLGLKILYFPSVTARHLGGRSFENKAEQKKHYYRSQDYYFEKHFGRFSSGMIRLLRTAFH